MLATAEWRVNSSPDKMFEPLGEIGFENLGLLEVNATTGPGPWSREGLQTRIESHCTAD